MNREVSKSFELASTAERFNNAWEYIKSEADDQNGWISTPARTVIIAREPKPVRLYAFVPTELSYEFGSKYHPSIYAEIGEQTLQEDGQPIGELDRRFVRLSDLESGYLQNRKRAEAQLGRVEEAVFAYQNYLFQ